MKKNIFYFGILFFFSQVIAFGLSPQEDQLATKILDRVSKNYRNYKTIKASFVLTMFNKQDKSRVSQKGVVTIKKNRFKVEMDAQDIYCDGKTVWTHIKDSKEVQITTFDPSKSDINPFEIFTLYQKGFLSKYMGEETKNGVVQQLIELTPQDKGKTYFKIKLSIEKVAGRIKDMTIFNRNGMESKYEITNFTPNVALDDSYFVYNIKDYPGTSVVDLR